jgi:hypothetical protein
VRALFRICCLFAVLVSPCLWAGEADVVKVDVKLMSSRLYRFDVTVAHADKGWDDYVDMWEVLAPDGSVLGRRTIFQPHENQSSFTSSLVGIKVPEGVTEVTVRAHDVKHGDAGKTITVKLPQ